MNVFLASVPIVPIVFFILLVLVGVGVYFFYLLPKKKDGEAKIIPPGKTDKEGEGNDVAFKGATMSPPVAASMPEPNLNLGSSPNLGGTVGGQNNVGGASDGGVAKPISEPTIAKQVDSGQVEESMGTTHSPSLNTETYDEGAKKKNKSQYLIIGGVIFLIIAIGAGAYYIRERTSWFGKAAVGDPCTSDSDCGDGFYCPSGTCLEKIGSGDDGAGGCCDNDGGCNEGEKCNISNGACKSNKNCGPGGDEPTAAPTAGGGDCKTDTSGNTNKACCCTNSDCEAWERCDIPNGACNSGKSCRSLQGCTGDSECGWPSSGYRCISGQCKKDDGSQPAYIQCNASENGVSASYPRDDTTAYPVVIEYALCKVEFEHTAEAKQRCISHPMCGTSPSSIHLDDLKSWNHGFGIPVCGPWQTDIIVKHNGQVVCESADNGCEWDDVKCSALTGTPTPPPSGTPTPTTGELPVCINLVIFVEDNGVWKKATAGELASFSDETTIRMGTLVVAGSNRARFQIWKDGKILRDMSSKWKMMFGGSEYYYGEHTLSGGGNYSAYAWVHVGDEYR